MRRARGHWARGVDARRRQRRCGALQTIAEEVVHGLRAPSDGGLPASLLNEMAVPAHIGAMAAARLPVVGEGLELPAGRGHRRQGHVERFPELCRRPHSSNGAPLGEVGRSAVA